MKDANPYPHQLAEHFFRHSYGRLVAILVNYFGLSAVQLAEDIVQDTLMEAMEKWSIRTIPDDPEAWLMDVAKKKTINVLKRKQLYRDKIVPSFQETPLADLQLNSPLEADSTLKMIFTCCHPALPKESQIALALKTLCGLSVPEIASALLTQAATINKRLYRAKQKFRDQTILYEIPRAEELKERLDAVFATLYLLFNEGYYSSHHEKTIRIELCYEAIRLLRQVITRFEQARKAKALMALMFLNIARFESRTDAEGALVILSKQDRGLWDHSLIATGMEYLEQAISGSTPSIYHLQAGIAAEHCLATTFESTNWESITQQYAIMEKLDDSPLVKLNHNLAKFYAGRRKEALQTLLTLSNNPVLQRNVQYYATVGVFFLELHERAKAVPYFETALKLSTSDKEKDLIRKKMLP
ncbi:MAG: sigma-70 family RNA polymerase sigma factor [Saprospiraceae bacterium]|nr:sigma-70 family RNA polymerase sigma factor [Saprospiraceae bacterium]